MKALLKPFVELKRLGQMLVRQGPVGTFWAGVDKGYRWIHGHPIPRFSHISNTIWLGGQPSENGLRFLEKRGITGIVNMRSEYDYAHLFSGGGLRYLHLPSQDQEAPDLDLLKSGVTFIRNEVEEGGRVYIHCWEGLGRGPTMAAAYFVSLGDTPEAAWTRIRETRPFVRPTQSQIEQLELFKKTYHPEREEVAPGGPGPLDR